MSCEEQDAGDGAAIACSVLAGAPFSGNAAASGGVAAVRAKTSRRSELISWQTIVSAEGERHPSALKWHGTCDLAWSFVVLGGVERDFFMDRPRFRSDSKLGGDVGCHTT